MKTFFIETKNNTENNTENNNNTDTQVLVYEGKKGGKSVCVKICEITHETLEY